VPLPPGAPFVVVPEESAALCVWPFLLARESERSGRPSLYAFQEIVAGGEFLGWVRAAAIDHPDTWESRHHEPGGAADHEWLWRRLAGLPQVVELPRDAGLAGELAEGLEGVVAPLAGAFVGPAGDERRYQLVGPIGRGGSGTVYDAVDTRAQVRVAVKVLDGCDALDRQADAAQLDRFRREYEALQRARLGCAGIIRVIDWGVSVVGRREYAWFSMEFAAGGDLSARVAERLAVLRGRPAWDDPAARAELVGEFRAVARAVGHLHDERIVHRDIKPANVLVAEGGELRLSDFGLIKDLTRPRGGTQVPHGTPQYRAPEQEGDGDPTRAVAPAADVYALGILLAELATGRVPTPDAVPSGSPVQRDAAVGRLPEALRRFVLRCTDRDPARRPAAPHRRWTSSRPCSARSARPRPAGEPVPTSR